MLAADILDFLREEGIPFAFVGDETAAVGQHTYISPKVRLGKNVRIGQNCTLDGDITIGDGTVIWNNVAIVNRVSIGKDCDIRFGAVIGHDGLSYTEDENHRKTMVKHFGGVTIGDRILISDNACVNRGTIDDTVLESGVKVGGLGHIAHNCKCSSADRHGSVMRRGGRSCAAMPDLSGRWL